MWRICVDALGSSDGWQRTDQLISQIDGRGDSEEQARQLDGPPRQLDPRRRFWPCRCLFHFTVHDMHYHICFFITRRIFLGCVGAACCTQCEQRLSHLFCARVCRSPVATDALDKITLSMVEECVDYLGEEEGARMRARFLTRAGVDRGACGAAAGAQDTDSAVVLP